MAHLEVEPGQFDDAPEGEISGRGDVAYIDTVQDLGEPQTAAVLEHEFPPSSDEEDEDEDDSLLDEDEYYDQNRVEDEDWEVAERGESSRSCYTIQQPDFQLVRLHKTVQSTSTARRCSHRQCSGRHFISQPTQHSCLTACSQHASSCCS